MNELIKFTENDDSNTIFDKISGITEITLQTAIQPFTDKKYDFFDSVKYSFDSLYVSTLYNVIRFVGIALSEDISMGSIIPLMSEGYDYYNSCYDRNKERLKSIKGSYQKRNGEHLKYLNSNYDFKPKLLAVDALYYTLLSDYPLIKRFLLQKEPIITKAFFAELDEVYNKISEYSGYNKYDLYYHLETDSKLEFYYKALTLIKKQKVKYKWNDNTVQEKILSLGQFQVIPLFPSHYINQLISTLLEPQTGRIFYYVICSLDKTINGIVFETDNLIKLWNEDSGAALKNIQLLNFIQVAVVSYLHQYIAENLKKTNSPQLKYNYFMKDITECQKSTEFFDNYLDNHTHIYKNKDCKNDITFDHFKTLYGIKREPPRKTT